jgi:tetratricopeptide (TPR) repeat protein
MEYSPRYLDIAQGPSVAQLPGLLVLVGALGLIPVCWRRSPATSFGIGWIVVTLLPASNFILPAGFIIAERTLLLPSVGAVIAIASGIPWLYERLEGRRVAQYAATAGVALLLALGLVRSYTRNRVWRDNYTLFHQGVLDAPDSYRAHYVLGTYLFENKRRRDGEMHYRRALELFPYDPVVLFSLADEYRLAGKCEPAIPLFRSAFEIAYTYRAGLLELSQCLLNVLDLSESKRTALLAIRFGAPIGTAHQLIAAANAGADSLAARRARVDTTYLRGTTLSSSK